MPDHTLAPGAVVAAKYRIERVLGEGGMGYVLGARSIALDEPVAIKVLKREAVSSPDAVARFFREARAAVRMRGVHVAKVLDVGALEDGTPYMLMELLEGSDLQALVDRYGPQPVQTVVDYVLQTCEALAEAHALGIVHRDIKPSNLFLTSGVDGSPCIKVLDFGISKATNAIDAARPDFGMTDTQTVMGSPQYMAPEQMRSSRRVDARTDIWALGTIMHELLAGAPPFVATSMPELFAMILQDPAPSLRVRRPDVPPALDAIVLRCLEKAPDKRPASVLELAQLLAPFASGLSHGAADRIARVGKTVAFVSEQNIAAVQKSRASSPDIGAPGMLSASGRALAGSATVPSGSELGLANTTRLDAHAEARRRRTFLVASMAVAGAALIAGTIAVALVAKGRAPAGAAPRGSAPSSSALVDLPPPAIDLPSATSREPVSAPSSVASSAASAPAGPPVAMAKRPNEVPAGVRAPASASARPAQPAPTADPPRPAATASSRYD